MTPLALLIEDRPEIAIMWTEYLAPLNVTVVHVTTLKEAFTILAQIPPPDLIILDLNLGPDSPAETTVRQIEKMKSFNPDVVVIVISGMLTPELIALAGLQGAHTIQSKVEMARQVDLWRAIEVSLAKAPQKARNLFQHSLSILETLNRKMTTNQTI